MRYPLKRAARQFFVVGVHRNVAKRDYTNQFAFAIQDNKPSNLLLPHDLYRMFNRLTLHAKLNIRRHNILYLGLFEIVTVRHRPNDDVPIGDHSNQPLVVATHRQSPNVELFHLASRIDKGRIRSSANNVCGHHFADFHDGTFGIQGSSEGSKYRSCELHASWQGALQLA
jgi:hypothetical protein